MKLQGYRYIKMARNKMIRFFAAGMIILGIITVTMNLTDFVQGYLKDYTYSEESKEMQNFQQKVQEESVSSQDPILSNADVKQRMLNPKTADTLYSVRPEIGEEMGELYIPRIESVFPIFHGTDEDELEKGVGHFADSVLPGEDDNSILSGHRDTVFRRLKEVELGDSLIVRTSAGEFEYKVNKIRIVDADDRTVIVPKPKATLTVSTCYPFQYIGAAPQRYILTAYLASSIPYAVSNNGNANN